MYRFISVDNQTRGTSLAASCRVAGSLRERIFGLHLLPRLGRGQGLLLPGSTTIDTTFMRYPIDLVFMDRSRRVTRVVHDMRPWRMVLNGGGGPDCLELPAGAAAASGTQAGDQLEIAEIAGESAGETAIG